MCNNTAISSDSRSRSVDIIIAICLYIGSLAIHIILIQGATIFNLTPDEYSVTAVAAYINGLDWSSTVSTGGYYGYFQSLFYVPVFWITDDPYLRYQLMLTINGMLISIVPVISYYLCRCEFDVKRTASLFFSGICGLYPCYLLLTKYTWNETMCCLTAWLFLLIFYKASKCKSTAAKQIFSVLGGLTLVVAYATHGRMLALLAAGIAAVLISCFVLKKKVMCLTGFFISIGISFAADLLIKKHLQDVLWLVSEKQSPPANTIERMVDRLFSAGIETVGHFFSTLAGHLYYFITATWGFGAICIVMIAWACISHIRSICKKTESCIDDNTAALGIFSFLLMGAAFAVSVLFKCTSSLIEERMDTAIYGRYTESFYPIAIFACLILLYKHYMTIKQMFASVFTAVGINIASLFLTMPLVMGGSRFVCAMILGIAPMRFGEGIRTLPTNDTFVKLTLANLAGVLVFCVCAMLSKKLRHGYLLTAIPLALLLGYSSVYNYTSYIKPQYKNAASGARYMQEAIDLVDERYDSIVLCDISKERYVKAQFLYPETEFEIINSISALSTLQERPEIVIANKADNLHLWMDGLFLISNINNKVQVYACSESSAEWAAENGLSVYGNGCMIYDYITMLDNGPVKRENSHAVIPSESSVYTEYMTLYNGASLEISATGDGINTAQIKVTADKGKTEIPFLISNTSEIGITIKINSTQKHENVCIQLKNAGVEDITFSSLEIKRISDSITTLPQ